MIVNALIMFFELLFIYILMDSKLYQVKNFNILNETYFNQLNKTPEQTARTFLHRT